MKKYTLDRIDDGQYVFLDKQNEEKQLLIPADEVSGEVAEGDIVEIANTDSKYDIKVLKEETQDMHDKVSSLLEKLKNKNK